MKLPKLFSILLFEDSRKVAFGLWLFAVSTGLLWESKITGDNWMLCMGASSVLIGGGTLGDRFFNSRGVPQNAVNNVAGA